MNLTIPNEIQEIMALFKKSGYEIYLVGGSVRDMLLGRTVKDWDLTTNATPEQMLELFPDAFYDNSFGTVGIPLKFPISNFQFPISSTEDKPTTNPQIVEVTTFRTERDYRDGRHPTHVEWGKSLEEDLMRRDFTINAMALEFTAQSSEFVEAISMNHELPTTNYVLIDPQHGQEDLEKKLIRAVGNPNERFKEDALRLMRAVRLASQLGFQIEDTTWKAIQEDAPLLQAIATERVRDELLKIIGCDYAYEGLMMLKNAGLLVHILPELLEGERLSQARPGRHHIYDVFTHNLLSMKLCPSSDPLVKFAALIHDIGKSRVVGQDQDGLVIFHNHEVAGARMAYEICQRLHFSKKDRDKVVMLVRWHMFSVDEHQTDAAIRRFIRRVGTENVRDIIDVRIGDRLGSGIPEHRAESWRLKEYQDRIASELGPKPFSITDLAINGKDIMETLNIKPGPRIGKILQTLFEEVDEDMSKNTREYLLERIKTLKLDAGS